MTKQCQNCRFWVIEGDDGFGECRRHGPALVESQIYDLDDVSHFRIFPETGFDDWCGDWLALRTSDKLTQ